MFLRVKIQTIILLNIPWHDINRSVVRFLRRVILFSVDENEMIHYSNLFYFLIGVDDTFIALRENKNVGYDYNC